MKKILLILLITGFTFQSCATLFAPKKNTLTVTSNPGGADVVINGYKMGETPLELSLAPNQAYTIEYKKDGYDNAVKVVNIKVGPIWVVLDVLAGLVPAIIDAATGSWNELETDQINVMLEKEDN